MRTRKELFIEFNNLGFKVQDLSGIFQNEMIYTEKDSILFVQSINKLLTELVSLKREGELFIADNQSKII
jgi:hypothetical protein